MGISINAKLIYGLPYSEIPEDIRDEVDELIDDGELDYASPWYDSPRDNWVVGIALTVNGRDCHSVGFEISCLDNDEVPLILDRDDIELKLYVSPDVT